IKHHGPSASHVILVEGHSQQVQFGNLGAALAEPNTEIRLFGKPEVQGERRMGVVLARGATLQEAREKAKAGAKAVSIAL
ncbi:MAG: phosphoribosylglycinamide formyltransferase 2, partial [Gemmatimonadota bacterium]|nr:phosphoribosylglycinamide formyltransferase 2 [Gemmatimonadota bacterium]